jgi:uncharacterized protein HemX
MVSICALLAVIVLVIVAMGLVAVGVLLLHLQAPHQHDRERAAPCNTHGAKLPGAREGKQAPSRINHRARQVPPEMCAQQAQHAQQAHLEEGWVHVQDLAEVKRLQPQDAVQVHRRVLALDDLAGAVDGLREGRAGGRRVV